MPASGCIALACLLSTMSVAATGAPMATVPAGNYVPHYGSNAQPVSVESFRLDRFPVTNGDYLKFVRQHPEWQRPNVPALFADEAYLAHWEETERPGEMAPADSPVTHVSWFAAKAYCEAQDKRLPTMDEWELAAGAGFDAPKPRDSASFKRRILDSYGQPARLPLPTVGETEPNYWGIHDLHGLVWEWVADFNSLMMTGGSRTDAGGLDRQLFCAAGSVGSADPSDYAAFMRYSFRSSARARHAMQNMGFRCAADAPAISLDDETITTTAGAIDPMSLHNLEGIWTDQRGKKVQLADFAGKTVVIAMAYTSCEHACPRIIADMRRIHTQVTDTEGLALVLASIDPQRDTVAKLARFGDETGLTARGWQLLTAPESTVRELAAALGIAYRRTSASDFAHSNVITVLGPDGNIRFQRQGLSSSLSGIVAAIDGRAETGFDESLRP